MPLKHLSPTQKKNVRISMPDNSNEVLKTDEQKQVPDVFNTQTLLNKTLKNEISFQSLLEKKMVGLLFSASWCTPNAEFVEQLKHIYKEAKEKNFSFEIIYVPFDDDKETCNKNYSENHGDWLLWPFDSPLLKDLRLFYQVDYLPKLIIIKQNFDIIAFNARKDLKERGILSFSNWAFIWKKSKKNETSV